MFQVIIVIGIIVIVGIIMSLRCVLNACSFLDVWVWVLVVFRWGLNKTCQGL